MCSEPPTTSLPRVALRWTTDGPKKGCGPNETWTRLVEREMMGQGWTLDSRMVLQQTDHGGALMRKPS